MLLLIERDSKIESPDTIIYKVYHPYMGSSMGMISDLVHTHVLHAVTLLANMRSSF